MDIKLGSTVCEQVTGFTGTATQILEQLNGNTQIAIQPATKEGGTTLPEAIFVDHHTLKVVDKGHSHLAQTPAKTSIKLGWRVRDKASGFEGIAVAKNTFLNGCVYFQVMPKVKDNSMFNENTGVSYIDHARLEYVDDGLVAEAKKVSPRNPGGPSARAKRQIF